MIFGKKVFLVVMAGADKVQIEEMQAFLKHNNISAKVINRPIDVKEL